MKEGHSASPAPSQSPLSGDGPAGGKLRLVRRLLNPYRGWLLVILVAMLVQTAMSIAAPWPLKIILDNVIGKLSGGMVHPAKTTADPEVPTERAIDSFGSTPSSRKRKCLLMMNRE